MINLVARRGRGGWDKTHPRQDACEEMTANVSPEHVVGDGDAVKENVFRHHHRTLSGGRVCVGIINTLLDIACSKGLPVVRGTTKQKKKTCFGSVVSRIGSLYEEPTGRGDRG